MPQNDFNLNIIKEFRANGGQTSGPFKGAQLLLLTTTGAKSGKEGTTPLVYTKDGDNFVIIASMGGAPKNPAWYHNIKANPEVTLEVGTEKFQAKASEATGPERERLYAQQAAMMPAFNEYKEKTSRTIPVVVLSRA
ncbi:MAG: nitroreductase family deazaflavin-dependent oxidoreductase [Tepidiformaceae bacterium]